MRDLINHIKQVAKNDVRIYFAPFIGAITAVKSELNRPFHQNPAGNESQKETNGAAAKQVFR